MAPRVHLLNRTVSPGRISCGKVVSRPRQYTINVREATCVDCADAHPSLTYEERNEILENANEKAGHTVACAGFAPQPFRYRKYEAPWEKCSCGKMQSRSWDGWFKAGNPKAPRKVDRTLHAPARHGGCGPMPPKEKKPRAPRAKVMHNPAATPDNCEPCTVIALPKRARA